MRHGKVFLRGANNGRLVCGEVAPETISVRATYSIMPASTQNQDLKQDVSALERKRRTLEQIGDIIRAIETMQESLNAVLVMGVASKDLPEEALDFSSSLSRSRSNLPINRIKDYYANLEIIVKKQLNRILNYSDIDFSSDEDVEFITLSSEADAQSPVELLHAFKRTAQTAVSLRVLLCKRGVATPASVLPATAEVLQQHLTHLNQQEEIQRGRIKHQIKEMQADIVRMIENPGCPDAMKVMLRDMAGNLDKDLQLLVRGERMDRLSFVAGTEEILAADTESILVEEITL
jgi:hypothetical protein